MQKEIKNHSNVIWSRLFRISAIGVGTISGPGLLFALPYLLSIAQFASFAAVLAIAQLISSIGGFGLDVSCPRLGVKSQWAAVYSLLATTVASGIVFLGFDSQLSEKFILGSLIAGIGSLTAILHSYSLFAGRASLYGLIGLTKALVFLMVLVFAIYMGVSPSVAWLVAAVCGLLVSLGLLNINGVVTTAVYSNSQSGWKDVVQISAPLAIIVAIGALPFVLDRALAQHFLNANDFARYAVAVTWAAPVIYIGNIVQQSMIATKRDVSVQVMCCWGGGIFILSSIYILIVVILSQYFIDVPYFENGQDFICLWGWIVGWYAIYSTIGFPVNAVMQKYFAPTRLKFLACLTAGFCGIGLAFTYILYVSFSLMVESKLLAIILFTLLFAIMGVFPKIILVIKYLSR